MGTWAFIGFVILGFSALVVLFLLYCAVSDYFYEKKLRNSRGSYADDGIWGS